MSRISAYTGQIVKWSDLTKNTESPLYNLTLTPRAQDFESGKVTAPPGERNPPPRPSLTANYQ